MVRPSDRPQSGLHPFRPAQRAGEAAPPADSVAFRPSANAAFLAAVTPFGPSSHVGGGSRLQRCCLRGATTAAADFWPAISRPCGPPSPDESGQPTRSPEVSSTVFDTRSPDLRFAALMEMDFAVTCQLVRHLRLRSGSCPSTRVFAFSFFQTRSRETSPWSQLSFNSISLDRDFHPEPPNMVGTHEEGSRGREPHVNPNRGDLASRSFGSGRPIPNPPKRLPRHARASRL